MRKNPGTQPRIFPFLARNHRPHKYKIHMGQFCVLHMESRAEVSSILERHIVRQEIQYVDGVRVETVWVPDNADESRVHLNRELVSRTVTDPSTGKAKTLTIQQAVNRRIEEAGITKVRSNQNTCIEIIFSGSPETMCAMSPEQVNAWANDTLAWAQSRWGYENVVSATLHCDEKTPHMHVIVVPIVQGQSRRSASKERMDAAMGVDTRKYKTDTTRNRLCANEVYTKPLLYGYHTSYAETVGEKYGLSRGVRADLGSYKKHTSSIEYNRQLAEETAEKERLIKDLTADYAELTSAVENTTSKLSAQREIMYLQEKTIANNDVIIQNQEKQKASVVINDDAVEKQLAEKYVSLAKLTEEEKRLERSITDKTAEFDTLDKKVQTRRQQLAEKVDLTAVPQKGLIGYNAAEVTSFIESVKNATLISQMNKVYSDYNPNERLENEVYRLRRVEDEYKKLLDSPHLLQERLDELKVEMQRKSIENMLKYAVNDKDVHVSSIEVKKTSEGDDIFARFTIGKGNLQYAAHIDPREYIIYTDDSRITGLWACHNFSNEEIWWNLGTLDDIQQKREKEDLMSRLGSKLSKLVKCPIVVEDCKAAGNQYLVFATNGRAYFINRDGKTWSTDDDRIKTIRDCKTYAKEEIWKSHGDINHPKLSQGIKR